MAIHITLGSINILEELILFSEEKLQKHFFSFS
jgi:hypothetical protein